MKKISSSACLFLVISAISMGISLVRTSFADDVRWYNGQMAPKPISALLTNNPGYWGKMIPTDVTYSYPEQPTNPADIVANDKAKFGNRLLDGQPGGDWYSPVGMNNNSLVIDFDFHQQIKLNEVAVAQFNSHDLKLAQIEVKVKPDDSWRKVLLINDSKGSLHHLRLPEPISAHYVRLTLQAVSNITCISQVWMWGEAKPIMTDNLNGYFPELKNFPETKNAQPGDGTILSAAKLAEWRKVTGFTADNLTWQVAPTWEMLGKNPLKSTFLPGKEALQQSVHLTATQTEGESAAVFLVNASDKAKDVNVHLDDFKDQTGKSTFAVKSTLYAAGAIWTRRWGQTLRPLFSADNKLGGALMEKYLTNGSVIKDFPMLHLPPRGTALLWITLSTKDTAPGIYRANLTYDKTSIPIELKVEPITLPTPDVWVRFWGNAPASTTNLWSDDNAIRQELEYQLSMGNSVYDGWPVEGSYIKTAQHIAKQMGRKIKYIIGISPSIRDAGYGGKLDPNNLGETLEKQVRDEILQMVQTAHNLDLSYDDWSVELWDEPTPKNMQSWAAIARLIKSVDPQVQLFINPLFWTVEGTNPAGFTSDQRQVQSLSGWYSQLVDISTPILGQVNIKEYPEANRQFYDYLPRAVRAFYIHPNPGRKLPWEAFERDYNGWGFYAYYAPRKDAWNDFDSSEFDYQIVYPGPNGYIPTIESESMRESWEDYRLLTLLKQQGQTEELSLIQHIYTENEDNPLLNETVLPQLRDRMLKDVAN